jgi:hypothetical protein
METSLLDAAFLILTSHEFIRTDPLNLYVSIEKAQLHELKRQFPEVGAHTVEDAYKYAKRLLEVAIDLAELYRGPRNDYTGPPLYAQTLAERCPGFSNATYDRAVNEGFMLTR